MALSLSLSFSATFSRSQINENQQQINESQPNDMKAVR